jgi:hypothetical protein
VKLHSDAELAELLGIEVADVRRGCRTKGWPCVRPKNSVWRFTDQQVEQIVAMQSRGAGRPKKKTSAAKDDLKPTKRSAARAT